MKKAFLCVALCFLLLLSNVATVAVSAEDNYSMPGTYLEIGTADYAADTAYPYTVYGFSPSEVGKYTISCDDHLLGLASYNDMWVTVVPSASTVTDHAFEWSCSSVGQGILIAVETSDATVTITVTQGSLEQKEEVQWTVYQNKTAPSAFTFSGTSSSVTAVNTADNVTDAAVLGLDGYYHLNQANGPILYANTKDSAMSLATVSNYGQLKEVVKDESGTTVSKTDFNTAAGEYITCSDSKTGLYPLTNDLIQIFKRVGAYQGWYGNTGFVGGTLDDAWMFACYYISGETTTLIGDVNLDGNLNLADATRMFYVVNGMLELSEEEKVMADCNTDGALNLSDATVLFYFINGLFS